MVEAVTLLRRAGPLRVLHAGGVPLCRHRCRPGWGWQPAYWLRASPPPGSGSRPRPRRPPPVSPRGVMGGAAPFRRCARTPWRCVCCGGSAVTSPWVSWDGLVYVGDHATSGHLDLRVHFTQGLLCPWHSMGHRIQKNSIQSISQSTHIHINGLGSTHCVRCSCVLTDT